MLQQERDLEKHKTCAFVPTMGALHEGHLSLLDCIKDQVDTLWVSIFVNPKQFGPSEDFESYPRQLDSDLALLAPYKNVKVYLPQSKQLFNKEYDLFHPLPAFTTRYCGASRPGFFEGVVRVLLPLFDHVKPDYVVFGEKDYQQVKVVEWLINMYKYPIKCIAAPTFRQADGLAYSSRNKYLSEASKHKACALYHCLMQAKKSLSSASLANVMSQLRESLLEAGFTIDYLEILDPDTLEQHSISINRPRLLAAVFLEGTRLIDNVEI